MSQFNILYNNINSYNRKKNLINYFVENNDISCVLLVETKTKIDSNTTYRDWNTIQLNGNKITNLPRGGSMVQSHPKLKTRKENPPSINNQLNETIHFSMLSKRTDYTYFWSTFIQTQKSRRIFS